MKWINNYIQNTRGSISLEAVVAMAGVLLVSFLGVAYFTYMVPRQALTQEVHTLATAAKLQGGLTNPESQGDGNSDIERFQRRLAEKGYTASKIEATAEYVDKDGIMHKDTPVIGVDPLELGATTYLSRETKGIITIKVQISAKMQFLDSMSKWVGIDSSGLGSYNFTEVIMSERY